MGNFWAAIKRGLYWIWKIIKKIIEWLCSYLKIIFKNIAFFLNKHESKIKSADNPKIVGKYTALTKMIKDLEKLRNQVLEEKKITQRDLDLINELTGDDDDFSQSVDSSVFDKEIDKIIKDNNI